MIETKSKPWYEARRGELLAEQFLLDLEPKSLASMSEKDFGFDYMAFFATPEGAPVAIAVEVKTTQEDVKGKYVLASSQARYLLSSNLPVIVVVVDVKDKIVYFNWMKDALSGGQKEALDKTRSVRISLREATAEERDKLRREIILH